MLAIFIMLIGLLGLMQTVNVALMQNMTEQLRNGAVLVADQQMTMEMAKPFTLISTNAIQNCKTVQWQVTNGAFRNYSVMKAGTNMTVSTKSVLVTVTWKYKGLSYSHVMNSLLSTTSQ